MIRPLGSTDVDDLLRLRREALITDPKAFSASESDDVGLDRGFVLASLARTDVQVTLGAFEGDTLVGMAGVHRRENEKETHKANLWGMFVRPENRGEGHGRGLLAEAIRFARSLEGVTMLQLCVSASASDAFKMYQRYGFTVWGVETASFIVDGVSVDVRHMVLPLESGGGLS